MSSRSQTASHHFVFDPRSVLRKSAKDDPAQAIIEEAERRAEQILSEAESRAAQVLARAEAEGLQRGQALAEQTWGDAIESMEAERVRFDSELDQHRSTIERELVDLALEMAARITRAEIERDSQVVMRALKTAMTQLRDRTRVTIRVNSADLELVRKSRDQIASWVDGLRDIEIVDDRRISRGGLVIESGDGTMDARPSSQLAEIKRQLLEVDDEQA